MMIKKKGPEASISGASAAAGSAKSSTKGLQGSQVQGHSDKDGNNSTTHLSFIPRRNSCVRNKKCMQEKEGGGGSKETVNKIQHQKSEISPDYNI